MCCIGKGIFRWGLIGALAVGGLALVSPQFRHALGAGVDQVKQTATSVANNVIDDPVLLRRQLAELTQEYPDRIAEVQGEIAEIDTQLSQLDRDMQIADRVVAMTSQDLAELKVLVDRAEARKGDNVRNVAIRFDGIRYDVDEAYGEARRIRNVRETYRDRLAHDDQQVKFLQEQRSRLNEILGKLESEYETLQAQLWNLDRQIDAIERNERLIEMTEEQQETLEGYDRLGKVANLRQLEAKLAELQRVQQAQLETLSKRNIRSDYENRASWELDDAEENLPNPFEDLEIERTRDVDEVEKDDADRSIAFSETVIIE